LAILNGDLPVSCDSDSLVLNRYKHVSKGLENTFFFSFRTYSNYENKSLVITIFNLIGLLSIVILICGISSKLSLDVFYIKWIARVFGWYNFLFMVANLMALFSIICAFNTSTLIWGNLTIYNAIENPRYRVCFKKGFLL